MHQSLRRSRNVELQFPRLVGWDTIQPPESQCLRKRILARKLVLGFEIAIRRYNADVEPGSNHCDFLIS